MSREKRLEFPGPCFGRFSWKVKVELEVAGIASFGLKALSVDKKKIVQLIGNGIIEEARDAEKPPADQGGITVP